MNHVEIHRFCFFMRLILSGVNPAYRQAGLAIRQLIAGRAYFIQINFFSEDLILVQDERWRRG